MLSTPQGPPPASASASAPAPAPNPKPHVCTMCGKAVSTSGHLSRHTRLHSGGAQFVCSFPGCNARCSRKDNLRQQCV
ncbi:hypothetical protein GGX14DRAFT_380406, partial [Mycena pura]